MALSLQLTGDVARGVVGVNVSGVDVSGTRVGTINACLVGGRVDVTKRGGAGVAVSTSSVDTFTHEVNIKMRRIKKGIFLNIVFLGNVILSGACTTKNL